MLKNKIIKSVKKSHSITSLKKTKKGVESYIFVLFIVSVIMGLFLVFILDGIYGQDHANCNLLEFEMKDFCKNEKSLEFSIVNKWNSTLDFSINEKLDPQKYRVKSGKSSLITIIQEGDFLNVIPIIKVGNNNYVCNGRLQRVNTEIIGKC